MDRNKICEALKNCLDTPKCKDCPWEVCEYEHEIREFPVGLIKCAFSLIADGVKPINKESGTSHYCGECLARIFYQEKYCSECGRKVDWS
jgi:hypothetical protein